MTKVNIDLWVLLAGVAVPSACLLLISLSYCWRRLSRRRRKANVPTQGDTGDFNQQMLLEMVIQQTDNALNSIVDAVHQQRIALLTVLETHELQSHLSMAAPSTAPLAAKGGMVSSESEDAAQSQAPGAKIRTKETAAIFDPYSQIPELIQKGVSVGEIATRLNLPGSAVELYIKLRLSTPEDRRKKTA